MLTFKLAIRYMFSRPISYLAAAAVGLCVFVVMVVMTVMNGLVAEFKEKNHNFAGDCIVYTDSLVGFAYYEEFDALLKEKDFVNATSIVIKGFALATQTGYDNNIGVEIVGIDPVRHSRVTNFDETVFYNRGSPEEVFTPSYNPEVTGCVVGIDMMPSRRTSRGTYYHPPEPRPYELSISGFPLTVKGALARGGSEIVNSKTFFFSDDIESGLVQVDGRYIFIPFEDAALLTGMDLIVPRAAAIHIGFTENANFKRSVQEVESLWKVFVEERKNRQHYNLLDNVRVESWKEFRRETIAAMEKEQLMLSIIFAMLGIITVFIIFVVFYMIISHKSRDIGILKSVGMSAGGITGVFIIFACLVGLLGSLVGCSAGAVFLHKINDMEDFLFEQYGWQLWDRSIYAIGEIPNRIEWEFTALVVISAVAVSIAGALGPGIRIARRRPADILQVNQI